MTKIENQLVIESILESYLVPNMTYHSELPEELSDWYCYTTDGGHNILCCLMQFYEQDNPSSNQSQMVPVPVKTVLNDYIIADDYVIVDLPYDSSTGLIFDSNDEEF